MEHFDYNGRIYAWNANTGTSMATPVVAGAVALWLQANPHLTPEDVINIISKTSRHPETSIEYPNNKYGYGEIDVYKGLLHVLGLNKIEGISMSELHKVKATISADGILHVAFPTAVSHPLRLRVFSLQGKLLHESLLLEGSESYVVSLGILADGVYLLQLVGEEAQTNGSLLIRKK